MSRIFWDTNLFIYLIEDHGELSERVAKLRKRMIERNDDLYTSTLTLGEILVKPLEAEMKYSLAVTKRLCVRGPRLFLLMSKPPDFMREFATIARSAHRTPSS